MTYKNGKKVKSVMVCSTGPMAVHISLSFLNRPRVFPITLSLFIYPGGQNREILWFTGDYAILLFFVWIKSSEDEQL